MKKLALCLLIPAFLLISENAQAQQARFPIVKGFGGIYEIANAEMPDTGQEYRIVVDLKALAEDKSTLNPGLNNLARMMNLHGLGGVPEQKLHVVAAIHGSATEAILTNGAYRKKNGVDNPNLDLIKALKEAGAELYVCGQSLLARGYAQEEVNPEIKIGLSMLTVVTDRMHKGYKLLVFE